MSAQHTVEVCGSTPGGSTPGATTPGAAPGAAATRGSPLIDVNTASPGRRTRLAGTPRLKSPKARSAAACTRLEQLPNIGPAMASDLRALGIHQPQQLAGADALALYQALCRHSGKRQDPCVLDTFMAATDFMRGAEPLPWWAYTAERKRRYGQV